jgi:hypothetical protein
MSEGYFDVGPGRFARFGDGVPDWLERSQAWRLRPQLLLLAIPPLAIIGAFLIWGNGVGRAESESTPLATATIQPTPAPAEPAAPATGASLNPPPAEQSAPAEPPVVNGLKIYSQSWRRGGLGSNALFTFTLRNNNEYAVKDVEIHCAFTRRDGSHLTDRTRVIPDTIEMKSRKTFTRMHVGFVNVNASKAICSLVTASRS